METIVLKGISHAVEGNEEVATDDILFPGGGTASVILKSNGSLKAHGDRLGPVEQQQLFAFSEQLKQYAGQPPLITAVGTLRAFLKIQSGVAALSVR